MAGASPIWKRTSFRLSLWYSTIFICSTFILFTLSYFLLSELIRESDRKVATSKLTSYEQTDRQEGLGALIRQLRQDSTINTRTGIFVRIADPLNRTMFLTLPEGCDPVSAEDVAPAQFLGQGNWLLFVSKKSGESLEITSRQLANGVNIQVGFGSSTRRRILGHFKRSFVFIMGPVILLGIAGGYLLAHRSLRPVRDLIETVRGIDAGHMETRVPMRNTGDELDDLVLLFNRMLERIQTLIVGMRSSLDNVAHDLRTPLTRLRAGLERVLLSGECAPQRLDMLQDSLEETDRISTMLAMLMDISEAETGAMRLDRENTALAPIIRSVCDLYEYVAEEKEISLVADIPEELNAFVDPGRIGQILANLVDNAIKYTLPGGSVTISGQPTAGMAVIEVRDTGIGVAEDEIVHIFDRLYRADKSRSERGLGLGLSLVRAIVGAHDGHIEVESEEGKGSSFIVWLPRTENKKPDKKA